MQVDEDSDSDAPKKPVETRTSTIKKQKKKSKREKAKLTENIPNKSPQEDQVKVTPKKKQKRKLNKEKRKSSPKRNSFSFDDLDKDWLSVLENRQLDFDIKSFCYDFAICFEFPLHFQLLIM